MIDVSKLTFGEVVTRSSRKYVKIYYNGKNFLLKSPECTSKYGIEESKITFKLNRIEHGQFIDTLNEIVLTISKKYQCKDLISTDNKFSSKVLPKTIFENNGDKLNREIINVVSITGIPTYHFSHIVIEDGMTYIYSYVKSMEVNKLETKPCKYNSSCQSLSPS